MAVNSPNLASPSSFWCCGRMLGVIAWAESGRKWSFSVGEDESLALDKRRHSGCSGSGGGVCLDIERLEPLLDVKESVLFRGGPFLGGKA